MRPLCAISNWRKENDALGIGYVRLTCTSAVLQTFAVWTVINTNAGRSSFVVPTRLRDGVVNYVYLIYILNRSNKDETGPCSTKDTPVIIKDACVLGHTDEAWGLHEYLSIQPIA